MMMVLYYEEHLTPKTLHFHFPSFLPLVYFLFFKPSSAFPFKLANKT